MRWPESQLDVPSFEATKFANLARHVQQQGIRIYQISALQALDPDWQRNLYELDWACALDEPSPDPLTQQPFENYVKQFLNDPNFMPEAWFIARDGQQYVGLSGLLKIPTDRERFYSGFTGVLPSHRRRGIATALKVRAIEFARQHGVKFIKTNNEENNPMYNLNLRLGFQPGPAWLAFKKIIREETSA
jgi:GNAT superfamily N-acetyltransferase